MWNMSEFSMTDSHLRCRLHHSLGKTVTSSASWTAGHTGGHTRPVTRFTTGIGPLLNHKCLKAYSKPSAKKTNTQI